MSELEKRERARYQSKRKGLILLQTVIVILLTAATLITAVTFIRGNKNAYVYYTAEGNVIYRAYLADNDFYEEEYLNGSHAYVASLIDRMTADFSYDLKMPTDANYRYSCEINARLVVTDKSSKTKIYDSFHEVLWQETAEKSGDSLSINKLVEFDYQKYDQLADDFNRTYSLKNTDNTLLVTMDVNVIGMSESFAHSNRDAYTVTLELPLLQSVVSPAVSATVPAGEQKIMVKDTATYDGIKIAAIVCGCADLIAIVALILYIFLSIDKHIDYARKVKKLCSDYSSYIQRISNPLDFSNYQVLNLFSFKDLLEIRDTVQSPILMYENEDQTRARFFIVTALGVLYLYEITVEGLVASEEPVAVEEPETVEEPVAAEEPIAAEEPVAAEEPETVEESVTAEDPENVTYVIYKKSYTARVIQFEDALKEKYIAIKRELLAYKKAKARTSWGAETFSVGRVKTAKLTVRGRSLWLNLNLSPADYMDSKYPVVDCSDKKKFAEVPVAMKIKSNRSLKYALQLIDDMMNGLGMIRASKQQEIVAMPYEDDAALLAQGYIREIYLGKKNEGASVVRLEVGDMFKKNKTDNTEK